MFNLSEFFTNGALLALGALLTGILVPRIKASLDAKTFKARTRFEANLERQSRVIDARVQGVARFSEVAWALHHMALEVAYNGKTGRSEEFEAADKKFNTAGWEAVERARSHVGGLRWLLSGQQHSTFRTNFAAWVDEINGRYDAAIAAGGARDAWEEYFVWLKDDSASAIDGLTGSLSDSFSLPGDIEKEEKVSGPNGTKLSTLCTAFSSM